MANKEKDVLVLTEVYLTHSQIETVSGKFGWKQDEQARGIGRIASGLLQDIINGGMMLPPMVMDRLRESVGEEAVSDSASIITLVERGSNRDGGRVMVPIYLDPLYVPNIQERADVQGVDLTTFLQNFIDQVLEAGWLYEVDPPPFTVRFNQEEYNRLRELCGIDGSKIRPMFSDDIMGLIDGLKKASEVAA